MSDFGDGLGTAVEGGLFARAIGGNGGRDTLPDRPLDQGHFSESACLNCGTALQGPHCHQCGQAAHLHRTMGAFLHDLLHGALHFEGRTWKTLPKLAFKPGELTRRYIEGERTRFVSPMALFLFCVFLMFAVFQFAGISAPTDLGGGSPEQVAETLERETERVEGRIARIDDDLAAPDLAEDERAELESDRSDYVEELDALRQADSLPFLKGFRDGFGEDAASQGGDGLEAAAENDGWIRKAFKKWERNPGLMLYKLQTNFYKFSWLLIPLSIPFVWLLFAWKRDFKAYDHAIFVTYSLSFMTLLILTLTLLGMAGVSAGAIFFASTLIPAIHIYKQLRGAYGLSRFSAFWRLCVLTVFITIILTLFLQLLLVIGAF